LSRHLLPLTRGARIRLRRLRNDSVTVAQAGPFRVPPRA
jgi:hypothetical protein